MSQRSLVVAGLLLALVAVLLGVPAWMKKSASPPASKSAASPLAWPLDCYRGEACLEHIGYPDVRNNGQDFDCKPVDIRGHEGTDISITREAMDQGVNVYAAADGVVQWTFDGRYDNCPSTLPDCQAPASPMAPGVRDGYMVCTELGPYCKSGRGQCFWCFYGGNVVVIKHDASAGVFATRYDHLRAGSVRVQPGERVRKGQVIGLVGSAGKSTGPHLHFEIWKSTFYDPYDPWTGACHAGDARLWPFPAGGPSR